MPFTKSGTSWEENDEVVLDIYSVHSEDIQGSCLVDSWDSLCLLVSQQSMWDMIICIHFAYGARG